MADVRNIAFEELDDLVREFGRDNGQSSHQLHIDDHQVIEKLRVFVIVLNSDFDGRRDECQLIIDVDAYRLPEKCLVVYQIQRLHFPVFGLLD